MDHSKSSSKKLLFLGLIAAFLTVLALAIFYAPSTWAEESFPVYQVR